MTALTWTIIYDPTEGGEVSAGCTFPTMDFGLTLNLHNWTPGTRVKVSNGKVYTVTEIYTLRDEVGQHYRFDYLARGLQKVKGQRKPSAYKTRARRRYEREQAEHGR